MGLSIHIDLSRLERRFSRGSLENVQKVLCETVGQDSNKYAAQDTGALRDNMEYGAEMNQVIWPSEYANYVYNADTVKTDKNRNAHPHWFEYAKAHHLKEWVELCAETLERGAAS